MRACTSKIPLNGWWIWLNWSLNTNSFLALAFFHLFANMIDQKIYPEPKKLLTWKNQFFHALESRKGIFEICSVFTPSGFLVLLTFLDRASNCSHSPNFANLWLKSWGYVIYSYLGCFLISINQALSINYLHI